MLFLRRQLGEGSYLRPHRRLTGPALSIDPAEIIKHQSLLLAIVASSFKAAKHTGSQAKAVQWVVGWEEKSGTPG
jgi:hypothetical protein